MSGGSGTPAWTPSEADLRDSNVARLMRDLGHESYRDLHAWSVRDRAGFWEEMVRRLGIALREPIERIVDLADGVEYPRWLVGARLNIVDSCFRGDPGSTAVIHRGEEGPLVRTTVEELRTLSGRVARGLRDSGFAPGDAIAIDLPMTMECVAIYLGILRAGCVAVSIAESFAADEIATRLRLADSRGIFTGDLILRGGKARPLYEKVVDAGAPRAIVLAAGDDLVVDLRAGDLAWEDFLADDGTFETVIGRPDDAINILFSSGTTGEPKAIPWTQTTPLKCAADGWLHHDIRPGDVVAWPTSLGWMMGPWLVFAALINRATIALHVGAPTTPDFAAFLGDAGVTMLGLVPSLVKSWRTSGALEGADWSGVRVLSSTGEASNADDYRWLMERAGAPVIEYCGGTEIGGGYVTGTVVHPAVPATFTTPALGLDLVLLDEDGRETDEGEVFLVPPSIGLSTTLLNRDHHEVYFEGTPPGPDGVLLRRHGDRMDRLPDGSLRAQGRADDTMNLGGIKVGSAEIERVLNDVEGVLETAAVAVPPPGGGPERLVVFAVPEPGSTVDEAALRTAFQVAIRERLNPLFRVHEVLGIEALPRTASNKVMRRVLRDRLGER